MGLWLDVVHLRPGLHTMLPPAGPAQCPPGLPPGRLSPGVVLPLLRCQEPRALVLQKPGQAPAHVTHVNTLPPVPGVDVNLLEDSLHVGHNLPCSGAELPPVGWAVLLAEHPARRAELWHLVHILDSEDPLPDFHLRVCRQGQFTNNSVENFVMKCNFQKSPSAN